MRPLPPRLQTVIDQLSPCALLADIGCDHAMVPVAAVRSGKAEQALACDLRAAPLAGAKSYIDARGVADRVTAIQTDGMQGLGERGVDAVTMAGMSGALMVRICEDSPGVVRGLQQLVVQPNTEAFLLRQFARAHGLHIEQESLTDAGARSFLTLHLVRGLGPDPAYVETGLSEEDAIHLGPLLLKARDTQFRHFVFAQRERLEGLAREFPEKHAPPLARFTRACALFD